MAFPVSGYSSLSYELCLHKCVNVPTKSTMHVTGHPGTCPVSFSIPSLRGNDVVSHSCRSERKLCACDSHDKGIQYLFLCLVAATVMYNYRALSCF